MAQPDRFSRFRQKQQQKAKTSVLSFENLITWFFLLIAIGIWFFAFPLIIDKIKPTFDHAMNTASFDDGLLRIVMLDVGQGDAILIKTPSGKFALIDGGDGKTAESGYAGVDAGNRVIVPYLAAQGITRLDWVIMTHPHFDHGGGLVDVINSIEVNEFIEPGIADASPFYEELLKAIRAKKVKYTIARAGDLLTWDPALAVQVLSAGGSLDLGVNNSSIVLRLAFGSVACLFTGDAEYQVERELLGNYGSQLKADILKAGHHGSKTSTSLAFIQAVRPKYALISVGTDNRYGHPSEDTLNRLKRVKAKVLRTDNDGTIVIRTNGKEIEARGEK